jgi:hypothetical protein
MALGQDLLAIGDVLLARFVCTNTDPNAQVSYNLRYYRVSNSIGTGQNLSAAAAGLETVMAPLYKALMGNVGQWYGSGVKRIRPTVTQEGIAKNLTGVGTAGASMAPSQISGLLMLIALVGGRHGRGHTYVPFPAAADVAANGLPTAGYLTRLGTLGTALTSNQTIVPGANQVTLVPVMWNKVALTTSDMAGPVNRPYFSQQRRRSQGKRPDVLPF